MKELKKVAKELNKVLGLTDPPIKTDRVTKKALLGLIKEGAALIDPSDDEFTEETIALLKELGFWPGKEEKETPKKKTKGKGKKAPVVEEEEDEEEEDEEEEDKEEEDKEEEDEEEEDEEEEDEEEEDEEEEDEEEEDEEEEDEEEEDEEEEEVKPKGKKGKTKKEKPAKEEPKKKKKSNLPKREGPSFQEVADGLLADGAKKKKILSTFVKLYKDRKGIEDEEYIQKRANIYMKIAKDNAK